MQKESYKKSETPKILNSTKQYSNKESKRLLKKIDEIESKITECEGKLKSVESLLSDNNIANFNELITSYENEQKELDLLFKEWERLNKSIEKLNF